MKNRGTTVIEVLVALIILAVLAALIFVPPHHQYKDVCVGGVVYIRDANCRQCSLTPKIDPETLQPQRCTIRTLEALQELEK